MATLIPTTPRDNKTASVKISILQSTLNLIGKNSFEKVHVNDICEKVEISKVTFFKYFPQKEDILLYYLRVWSFDRAVELSRDPKTGADGIRFLFNKVCQSYDNWPGMWLGAIGYFTKLDMPVKPFPLKSAERKLLYPDFENVENIEMRSLDQLFENFLLEAIFHKEITRTSDVRQLVELLDTILYGTIMTAHVKNVEYKSHLFKHNVDAVLDSLGQGEMSFV